MKYIMSIDQGTTGTTVSLVNEKGEIAFQANEDFKQYFPKPGWVEHHPEEIWQTVLNGIQSVLKNSQISSAHIVTIGITNQRETIVAWDKTTGQSLHPAIVWQCRRTENECQKLKQKKLEKKIHDKTGLYIDPYFSATKIKWLLDHVPEVKKAVSHGTCLFGTIDSYLLFKLTDGASHFTDVSNASRTMLMNLKTLKWDSELLKIFKIPEESLPQIKSSVDEFGKIKKVPGLPDGIPIQGIAGDQQAALFGQACFDIGESKCTFGTGSFILFNTGTQPVKSKSKLLTTVAWRIKNEKPIYALEGGAYICGAAVQWLRDGLGIINRSEEVETLALKVKSSDGVEFVPSFSGLGAPHWVSQARGEIRGLSRGTNMSHIAFATLEAMALQNVDILLAMQKDIKKKLKTLKVDGGATANSLLMQMQSNYLGCKVLRPKNIESTSLGAAFLAGLGAGVWKSLNEIRKIQSIDRIFSPSITSKVRMARHKKWSITIDSIKKQFN